MSPMVTPNFDENPQLPPGEYAAKILACTSGTSKSGNPLLSFKFETLDSRQWVFTNMGLTGKGAQLFKSVVKAAFMPAYESGPIDTDQLVGKTLNIKVDYWEGQDGRKYLQAYEFAPCADSFDAFA